MAPSPTTTTLSSSTASATCLDIHPGKNGYLPPEACDVVMMYVPSFGAAVLFCVLYGMSTVIHSVQAYIYKKAYAWVIIMGAGWELLAFVFRCLQTRHQDSTTYDTMYTVFFLLAPIWINAFLYMTMGRMIHFFLPQKRLGRISARRYGSLFVMLDIVAFLVQLGGASLSTIKDNHDLAMMGLHLYMGGIGMQEFFVLCFLGLVIHFHRKLIHMELVGEGDHKKLYQGAFPWRWLFYSIYFALGMITIRIIFRISQYAQGTDAANPVLTHEWYEYVFDAAPMFLALAAVNAFHPGRILQGPDSGFPKLSRKEKKQLKKEKKQAKMIEKQRKKNPLWAGGDIENTAYERLTPADDGEMWRH